MARSFNPRPCASQRAAMLGLGFTYSDDQAQPSGVDWIGHGLTVNIRDAEELTTVQAVAFVVTAAMNKGASEVANGIKKYLRV